MNDDIDTTQIGEALGLLESAQRYRKVGGHLVADDKCECAARLLRCVLERQRAAAMAQAQAVRAASAAAERMRVQLIADLERRFAEVAL